MVKSLATADVIGKMWALVCSSNLDSWQEQASFEDPTFLGEPNQMHTLGYLPLYKKSIWQNVWHWYSISHFQEPGVCVCVTYAHHIYSSDHTWRIQGTARPSLEVVVHPRASKEPD
ncbi:unnamed protein product [Cuscuta epithymum]|uniref:Uncharacterized protein n=1 Tax=Cuscuta epithymum TaxID=186058 RepID=A0AAV0BXG5_9ASTE|nr:unnamed protein product [Cuscuta epithymum]